MVQFSVLALLLELILFQCVGEKWMLLITCIDRLMVQKSSYWKKSCDKLQTESATITIMTLNDLRCYHMLFFQYQLFLWKSIIHSNFSFCIFQLSPIPVYCNIADFSQWAKNTKRYISFYLIFFSAACVWDFGFPSSITQMLPASLFLQGILLILENTWLQRA